MIKESYIDTTFVELKDPQVQAEKAPKLKRKRGRPRKHPILAETDSKPKKRGRPRKHPLREDLPKPKRGRPKKNLVVPTENESYLDSEPYPESETYTDVSTSIIHKKSFRISAKRLFLTYSNVPDKLDEQEVLRQLTNKFSIQYYLISQEKHLNKSKHFHVLLESKTKFNMRDSNDLDLYYQGLRIHGNYQAARNYKFVGEYMSKDQKENPPITNFKNFHKGQFLTVEEDMIRVASEKSPEEANKYYLETYGPHALRGMNIRNSKQTFSNIQQIKATQQKPQALEQLPFKLKDFNVPPELQQWMDQGHQPTLLLIDDNGINTLYYR